MDAKLKHLDFIQGVINRLSTNSFLLKGWSVVLVSALLALSAKDSDVAYIILAYFPAIAFWSLDGYFLSLERRYRRLYDEVRTRSNDDIDFSMKLPDVDGLFDSWQSAFLSKTLLPFHGSLIGAILVVMLIQL
ncbi:MAG TPA: hypothetical protein PKE26_15870 [Kiritimatiellia bacterium]|nr:hypothetical protein [Kiritimatiellia bacterium]HMP00574.1 hypothetical protein [Kiritimatiellia bacterium]